MDALFYILFTLCFFGIPITLIAAIISFFRKKKVKSKLLTAAGLFAALIISTIGIGCTSPSDNLQNNSNKTSTFASSNESIVDEIDANTSENETKHSLEDTTEYLETSDTSVEDSSNQTENTLEETTTETTKNEVETPATNGTATVHILNVGQGLSLLIESNGHYMLYDGGDRSASSYVVSYLKKQGVSTLDYVIASHYDSDHINGVIGALHTFNIEKVLGPDYVHDSKTYQSFVNQVSAIGKEVIHPAVGTTYTLGGASFQILAPNKSSYSDANNYSIVIQLICGSNKMLIMGDAESDSEAEIISNGTDISTDVLVVGHHGSGTSTSWNLLQKAVPEYAIISCGADNSYGHPHIETMEKLKSMEIDVFRTDKQGEIIVTMGDKLTFNTPPCNDYTPGNSNDTPATTPTETQASTTIAPTTPVPTQPAETPPTTMPPTTPAPTQPVQQAATVYITEKGKKYHSNPSCSNMKHPKAVTIDEAVASGRGPCSKCY